MMNLGIIKKASEGLLGGIGSIISKFKADPTKVATLEVDMRKMVLEYELEVQRLAQQAIEAEVRDKASARAREVSLRNSLGVYVQNISAGLFIISFIALLFVTYLYEGNESRIIDIMIGAMATIVINIFGYWFGSSQGSSSKQNQINEILNHIKPPLK